jgi:protein gp37
LGPVDLSVSNLKGIHWVIVGGESGPRARPMNPTWVRSIKKACKENNVFFFFKQWGAFSQTGKRVGKKKAGRTLDGKTWNEMPTELIVS